jgi:hypothetical protein
MAKSKKPKKERANKYQEKLKVDASFDELMDALFPITPANNLDKKKTKANKGKPL